ncbi:wall-associated receptor kinase-like 1 [Gossypium hirsutum]|uniref:Wall-associated receptor kinase-like 1 n=1 Tax=Gossypium hirsutum TaxID=3635 RepID=A0ABM3A0B6_GOSHI|nr:wall-associated receptor kinase-like 1 [Gossypium hirsutum]
MDTSLVFYFILQLSWLIRAANSDCHETCGNVAIPLPFGIKTGCYNNSWFRVTCNQTVNGPKPFISRINLELLGKFQPVENAVSVNNPVSYINCGDKGNNGTTASSSVDLTDSPFFFSTEYNVFGSVGCSNIVYLNNQAADVTSVCLQRRCGDLISKLGGCHASISDYNLVSYTTNITDIEFSNPRSNRCTSAFIFDSSRLKSSDVDPQFPYNISINTTHVPATLMWYSVLCNSEAAICQKLKPAENPPPPVQSPTIPLNYKYGCIERCGNIGIPFPFGIEVGCYMNNWFRVTCKETIDGSRPFISSINLQLLDVSFSEGIVLVNNSVVYINCLRETNVVGVNLTGTPFLFSHVFNRFVSVGCDSLAAFLRSPTDDYPIGWCAQPHCNNMTSEAMCSADIPPNLSSFAAKVTQIYPSIENNRLCGSAFIVDQRYPDSLERIIPNRNDTSKQARSYFPTTLLWGRHKRGLCKLREGSNITCRSDGAYCWASLSETHLCVCHLDSYGDSDDVCQGCGASIGTIFVLLGAWQSHKLLQRRNNTKLKQKYFKRNGGLLLQQQLSNNEGKVEKIKVFTSKELEKATDYYNENRILGQDGQGTVYKGILTDGNIVAIKKSKLVEEKVLDHKKLKQFINEVINLSQINHRNVVKLLGCCLETKIPLLVYQFIPNGTLYDLLHRPNEEFPLTWEIRLRIAIEIANALSYLHSAASVPIYHRDIKSSNILLDDKYKAKVSDFGTSISIALEQTHVTTRVQGTFGYLDPEYFRSNQFTEKSDVYSFGVVLVELITGQKPISSSESEEVVRSLANFFLLSMEENALLNVVDPLVMNANAKEEIVAVAKLAKRCLNLNGKKRPTMKQVAMELEQIRSLEEANVTEQSTYEDSDIDDMTEASDIASCSTSSSIINDSVTYHSVTL